MTKVLDPSPSASSRHSRVTAKRLALGGVALTAATLATLGLYGHHADTFHHNTARFLTEIATAKGIEVSLRDRMGLEVHGMLLPKASTGKPTDVAFDGRLSYDFGGAQYNFTLLNDRAYLTVQDLASGRLTRTACVHPENVPPIATLTDALHQARVIDAASGFNMTCASGKMVEIEFAGEPFVLCANSKTAGGPGTVAVQGDDLQASLTLLGANSDGVPSLASLAPPSGLDLATCGTITPTTGDASLVTPPTPSLSTTRRVLQRTQDLLTVATGGRRLSTKAATDCGCTNGQKKQCLFVHGFGYSDTGDVTDTFKYFGTIEQQMPCCETVKFVHMDTNDEPWYSDKLTQKVCDAAAALTHGTTKAPLENLALVAHSMGNLIIAAAIMDGKCSLAKSSKWIALAGPMYGSKMATNGVTVMEALPPKTHDDWCTNDPNNFLDDPIFKLLESSHLCSTLTSLKSIVAKGTHQSNAALDALFTAAGEVYRANVGANLCGVSPIGILSADSAKKVFEAMIAAHPTPENDGQVHIDSCRGPLPLSQYSTSWDGGAFYRAGLNHADVAMRHGDGWWGKDRKPIKWLQCQF